ncbi:MAG: SRPBCC family protein [Bacteroidota bacterium]
MKTKITVEQGKQELFIEREFNAPRALVYEAFSSPELLLQWVGPSNLSMKIEKLENKSHGSWRFIHTDDAGNEYGFNGVIHEIEEPARIIRTFEFEGLPEKGHVSLEFLTLEELPNNRCKLHIQSIFKSVADRDGLVQSGMEGGMNEGFDKLDKIFERIQSKN